MYTIIFSDTAQKQLSKLPHEIQKRIAASLERIRIRPDSYVTKLVGDSAYKLRIGDYRVIMDIQKQKLIILILMVGHRKKIYK